MIALDTNVIVRYVMQDDARQAAQATRLIESLSSDEPGFVTQIAVVELGWVLTSAYGLGRDQVGAIVTQLLRTAELVVECSDQIWKALRSFGTGRADLSDCLMQVIAAEAGCSRTVTCDRHAAKSGGMVLLV